MPELDGLQATRRLLHDECTTRVLILTTFDLDEYVYEAMKAGASGFLVKDVRPEQLADAVRVVATGDTLLAPTITRRLIQQFVRRPPPTTGAPADLSELSERELEVLTHIAQGLSNGEIAQALFVTEATIKTHVTHILTKLRLRDRVQAVVLAYECGLVRPGEPPAAQHLTGLSTGHAPAGRHGSSTPFSLLHLWQSSGAAVTAPSHATEQPPGADRHVDDRCSLRL